MDKSQYNKLKKHITKETEKKPKKKKESEIFETKKKQK